MCIIGWFASSIPGLYSPVATSIPFSQSWQNPKYLYMLPRVAELRWPSFYSGKLLPLLDEKLAERHLTSSWQKIFQDKFELFGGFSKIPRILGHDWMRQGWRQRLRVCGRGVSQVFRRMEVRVTIKVSAKIGVRFFETKWDVQGRKHRRENSRRP